MPLIFIALLICLYPFVLQADDFEMYRWNEHYPAPSSNSGVYDKLKHIPLSENNPDSYLSIGGTLKERLNIYENDRFGLKGPDDGYVLLHRLLTHVDLKLNEQNRLYAELGNHLTYEHELSAGPFDTDRLDVTQLFFDTDLSGNQIRVGRQELTIGSGRLVSVRDGPNVRRSFDGVSINNKHLNNLKLFYLQQVDIDEGHFDNQKDNQEILWGVYSTWHTKPTNIDFYYLGLSRDDAGYSMLVDDEKRHTVGMRFFNKIDSVDWNYEFMYQFGDYGTREIDAWSIATVSGYQFDDIKWSPKLSLSANAASGDRSKNDQTINTFNPLFPNLSYFEEASILSPQNFFNIEPKLSLQITSKLSVSIDWNFFWRLEKEDAVYVRGQSPLTQTLESDGRFVAQINSLSADYDVNKYIKIDYSLSYFNAGKVIKEAGGEDVMFMKLQFQFTF